MTYYQDILCCTYSELTRFCSVPNYKYLVRQKRINKITRGCRGQEALIEFNSLPHEYREKLMQTVEIPTKEVEQSRAFADEIELDVDAVAFFKNYKPAGNPIEPARQRQYVNEASILNAVAKLLQAHLKRNPTSSQAMFWTNAKNVLPHIKEQWPHKLPTTEKNLKVKFQKYIADSYRSLVNGNYGNQNTRIVNDNIENLLKYIFGQHWKPNYEDVHRDYMAFVSGKKLIVSQSTGEIFNPADYEPVSVSTVRSYMAKWSNAVGTEKKRSGSRIAYNAKHRSYADLVVDHAGTLLSMDDRDIPLKLAGTNKRVVGYFSADACSGAIIGWAFARPKMRENDPNGKGLNLIFDCFRNTFEQLNYYGVSMPFEVEVENHLMSTLKETTLKEGNLFQAVRFAAAENPQEKTIEGLFRIIKYQHERKLKGFKARPFARAEANQPRSNDDTEYTFDQIVEIVLENILTYNNDLHPNQKKFPGMSRIEVFLENQHPKLLPIDWRDVSRWVGYKTTTSVNRGEVKANSQKFLLPTPELMDKTGIGAECMAYWFKHESGAENTIYLYRNDEFICELTNKPTFHKGRLEQTEADKVAMAKMQGFTRKIDTHAKKVAQSMEPIAVIDAGAVQKATETARKVKIIEDVEETFDYRNITRKTAKTSLLDEL